MANIGIVSDADTLVLWKGRDFKWSFENLDENRQPVDFPDGSLFIELQTGGEHNARQRVTITGATGGTYAFDILGETTPPIDYNDVSENPQGLPGDITEALEAAAGVGNVEVYPTLLQPSWILNFNLNSGKPLTEQLVNTINKTANDFFDTFEQLMGVDVSMTVTDALNFQLKVTSRRSFDEVGVVTFAVDVTGTAVKNFFNAVSGLVGAVNTVNVDFYWNRVYEIEFVGELANQPIEAILPDASNLTGYNPWITVEVIDLGKERLTIWPFIIDGTEATIKVESEEADLIPERTVWQLVFLPDGEPAGGDPITYGRVTRLGD
ncbi:minor tail protein [Mycobacterium phage Gilberta]|nr:minor tail protein [Mycobacterium phage Gilberta]UXE05053.1 minor tail protein [Mycobacterium phage MaCh]